MAHRFTRRRAPTTTSELAPHEVTQAVVAGERWTGERHDAESLFGGPQRGPGAFAFYGLELWDVVDERGTVRFEVWVFGTDAGVVFRAGTTDVVGDIASFAFASADDVAWATLAKADGSEIPARSPLRLVDFSRDG